ncbi:iron-sulfur cluster carrier protein ApbC [Algibacillus agarilyticus]|uniref:iron-sulfur cluster carrier protein ApbC n=1 Tax=Algibacillus agarilyticus TaxID=2234133 RepID=UPI000DCFB5CD|nr:iron-sulfur cluster carrier protein ApbC [Algibacillus agarilyticus]
MKWFKKSKPSDLNTEEAHALTYLAQQDVDNAAAYLTRVDGEGDTNKNTTSQAALIHSYVPLGLSDCKSWQLQPSSSLKKQFASPHANIKHIVAIASGKGGVGKSTTCVNMARALKAMGAQVGILDADIYGPSIPTMLGMPEAHPDSLDGKIMQPIVSSEGVKANSIGFLVDENDATVWRGPMASKALQQLFNETAWGELDYLLIDLPPGTGDIQLTIAQSLPISGHVIVSTPQDIALIDAKKALSMFEKVLIPALGLVENMNMHICENCGHESAIFGHMGAQNYAKKVELPFLGSAPLNIDIRQYMDEPKQQLLIKQAFFSHYENIALRMTIELAKLAQANDASEQQVIPITQLS